MKTRNIFNQFSIAFVVILLVIYYNPAKSCRLSNHGSVTTQQLSSIKKSIFIKQIVKQVKKQKLNQDSAELIIESYLKSIGVFEGDTNLVISYMYDEKSKDGKDYFVFHIFDNMKDHIATIGWYGVNKESGELYDFIDDKPIITRIKH